MRRPAERLAIECSGEFIAVSGFWQETLRPTGHGRSSCSCPSVRERGKAARSRSVQPLAGIWRLTQPRSPKQINQVQIPHFQMVCICATAGSSLTESDDEDLGEVENLPTRQLSRRLRPQTMSRCRVSKACLTAEHVRSQSQGFPGVPLPQQAGVLTHFGSSALPRSIRPHRFSWTPLRTSPRPNVWGTGFRKAHALFCSGSWNAATYRNRYWWCCCLGVSAQAAPEAPRSCHACEYQQTTATTEESRHATRSLQPRGDFKCVSITLQRQKCTEVLTREGDKTYMGSLDELGA